MPQQTFFKFSVGKEPFWMNIDEIQLVVPVEEFSTVPRTPPIIKGISEVRGKIVTLIDLKPLFGIDSKDPDLLHAALLSQPFNNTAICLHSDFDIVEISENISFTEVKKTESDYALGVKKKILIKSSEYRFLEANQLIHLCENHIMENVKRNLIAIHQEYKNEEPYSHR